MREIVPAILTSDIDTLKQQVHTLDDLVDLVQLDVMDGEFVDNLSVDVSELLKLDFSFQVSLHLMVEYPTKYAQFAEDPRVIRSIFHYNCVEDVQKVIERYRELPVALGMAVNPEIHIDEIQPYLKEMDLILLLSVTPGAQGQSFKPEVLEKVADIRKIDPDIIIGIDGGIKLENIDQVIQAGVDYASIGSGIWSAENVKERLQAFQNKINK